MVYISLWIDENVNYDALYWILLNNSSEVKKRFGLGVEEAIILGRALHAEFFLPEKEIKRIGKEGYKFFMNKKKFTFFIKEIDKVNKEMIKVIKKLVRFNLSKLNNLELAKSRWSCGSYISSISVCYSLTEPRCVALLEKELVKYLESKNIKDVPDVFTILTASRVNFVFEKRHDLYNKTIREAAGKANKNLVKSKFYTIKKTSQKEKNRLIKRLQIPERILHIADVLSKLTEKRMELRLALMMGIYYDELFIGEIIKRRKISKNDYRVYDSEEADDLLLDGKTVSKKIIEERKKGFMKILKKDKIKTLTGDKAIHYLRKVTKSLKNAKEARGTIASKGHVFGKVTVFDYRKSETHSQKVKDMVEGGIVITQMTRPNILLACEKASAIVTEEGGILCHAAIVSRELQVPCVIGIEDATRMFRDGDYAEVCANTGIVRKISETEYLKSKKKLNKIKKEKKRYKKLKLNKLKEGDIFWFEKIRKKDVTTVGGKGANLGELSKFVTVPKGFCISVNPYSEFLRKNKLDPAIRTILKGLKLKDNQDIERRAKKIQKLIMRTKISPKLIEEIKLNYEKLKSPKVAVRSSATAEDLPSKSFAGQQDTYLNINGADKVINNVQKCWASLFTTRAIYYREKNKFSHSKVLISVVIQEMVNSKYSGVMFTEDPLAKKDFLIEVIKGVGEKLVSGEETPNSYLIHKKKFKICEKQERFKFYEHFLKKLVNLCKKIEKHYKTPQDIEWSIDQKNKVYILQSRAITT